MSRRYLENISHNYDLYVRDVGDIDITKFKNIDALRIVKKALKVSKTAGETVRHTLTQMMEKAFLNDIVRKNVCKNIDAQPRNRSVKQPLSKRDEKMLLKGCTNQLHKDMIEFNINTGLRISELLGLSFDEVDLDKKFIIKYVYETSDVRYYYEYIPLNFKATIFTNTRDKEIFKDYTLFYEKTPEQAVENIKSTTKNNKLLFIVVWSLMSAGVIFWYISLDNNYLED